MYDRRSIYALNKKNPDAMVLPDADGNLICLTCADFTDEAEFRRWKRWSDQDFHAEDKSDVEESDHTTSMDMVPEAALAVPNEEALAEERQVREDQIRCAEAAVSGIRSILTGAQFYRLRQYCIEGKTESEIAEAEGVTQQAVSKSLVSALKKSRKFLKRGPKMVVKKPEKNVRFEREGIDTANVSSELITTIYAAFAQKESESISGNMRWSCQRRMESGEFNTCRAPWGFRLDGKSLAVHEEEAEIVRRIFLEYLSGRNPREIAEILNAEDTSGRIWKYKSVWRIATKPLFHRNYSTVQKNCGKDAASDRPSPMEGSASGCAAPAAPASGQSKSMADGTGAAADTMKKATAPSSPCRKRRRMKPSAASTISSSIRASPFWSRCLRRSGRSVITDRSGARTSFPSTKKYLNSPVRIKRWPSSSKTASLILTFLYPKATS